METVTIESWTHDLTVFKSFGGFIRSQIPNVMNLQSLQPCHKESKNFKVHQHSQSTERFKNHCKYKKNRTKDEILRSFGSFFVRSFVRSSFVRSSFVRSVVRERTTALGRFSTAALSLPAASPQPSTTVTGPGLAQHPAALQQQASQPDHARRPSRRRGVRVRGEGAFFPARSTFDPRSVGKTRRNEDRTKNATFDPRSGDFPRTNVDRTPTGPVHLRSGVFPERTKTDRTHTRSSGRTERERKIPSRSRTRSELVRRSVGPTNEPTKLFPTLVYL